MSFKKNLIPQKGDILRVHRKAGYYHYGIAVDDNTVIHFTGADEDLSKNNKEVKITQTSLARFLNGDVLEIESPYNAKYDSEEVVQRAKKYVNSQRFRNKYYNFVTNNCEHFANYCYYGSAKSRQVIIGTAVVGVVTGAAIVGAAANKVVKTIKNNKSVK